MIAFLVDPDVCKGSLSRSLAPGSNVTFRFKEKKPERDQEELLGLNWGHHSSLLLRASSQARALVSVISKSTNFV